MSIKTFYVEILVEIQQNEKLMQSAVLSQIIVMWNFAGICFDEPLLQLKIYCNIWKKCQHKSYNRLRHYNSDQLAPLYNHQTNPAKEEIKTFKYHLITGLFSVNPTSSLQLYCCLIPISVLTLKLILPSNINHILFKSRIIVQFDFNAILLASTSYHVLIHE